HDALPISLDAMANQLQRIDLIKIDIEGAEYLALSGGENVLKKHRPVIISEFAPDNLQAVSRIDEMTYVQQLLVDDDYHLAILSTNGEVIDVKRDAKRVIEAFKAAESDHIDIMACPF